MKIKLFGNNTVDNVRIRNKDYPIKEDMCIKVNGFKIKGLHNLKLFFEGILVNSNSDFGKIEISYLGEENK